MKYWSSFDLKTAIGHFYSSLHRDCRVMMLLSGSILSGMKATEICHWASGSYMSNPADWVWPITLITCLPCMWFQSQACSCSSSTRCVKTTPTVWGSHPSKQDDNCCRPQSLTWPYWPRGPSWKPPNKPSVQHEDVSACSLSVEAKASATRNECLCKSAALQSQGEACRFQTTSDAVQSFFPAALLSVWTLLTSAVYLIM